MQSASKLAEPSENVIGEISNNLILAVAEANRGNSGLRCKSLANPDLSSWVQLAEHIRALHSVQVVIQRCLEQRIADARRHQNALQPVNKLPAEVLSVIFHQFLATVSIYDYFTSLSIIARVSAHWKSIIDSTPSLWSFVSSTYPAGQVDRALRMSAQTPISVACRFNGDVLTATSKYGSSGFLNWMRSTGRPWDELDLYLPSIGHLRKILEASAPHLRKLKIEVAYPSSNPTVLFGGKRGVLEDVSLINAHIVWKSKALTELRSLQLDYREGGDFGLTLAGILWLLQQSPHLRSFAWSGQIPPDSNVTAPMDTTTLSHLSRFSLKDISVQSASTILASIHAPSCRHLTLHCNSEVGETTVLSHLERFLPSLKKSLDLAPISACLGPSSFHYHHIPENPDPPSRFDFKFEGTKPYLPLDWFSQHLYYFGSSPPPVNIRFDPRFDFTRDNRILPALFRLRNTTRVTVADRVVGPCRLLEWLSRPDMSSSTFHRPWPFPYLRDLEIGQSNLLIEDILDFVRDRYIQDSPGLSSERPLALNTLRLVGRGWQGKSAREVLDMIVAEFSVKKSSWVHVPCQINEDPLDVEDGKNGSDASGSDASSSLEFETTSEMEYSDASESDNPEDGMGDE